MHSIIKNANLEKKEAKCFGKKHCKKVEFRSMAQGVCKIFWLKRVLDEIKRPTSLPVKLYCVTKQKSALFINQFYRFCLIG